jgi:hypothetical protein
MKQKVEEREELLVVRDVADGGPHCSVMKEKCTMLTGKHYSSGKQLAPVALCNNSKNGDIFCEMN